jgi:hypothetical protein
MEVKKYTGFIRMINNSIRDQESFFLFDACHANKGEFKGEICMNLTLYGIIN